MPKGQNTYDGVYDLKMMLISAPPRTRLYPRFVWFSGHRGAVSSRRRRFGTSEQYRIAGRVYLSGTGGASYIASAEVLVIIS